MLRNANLLRVLFALSLLLNSSCGFHLRGKQEVSSLLQSVHVDNRIFDSALRNAVEGELRGLGYGFADKAKAALVLSLNSENFGKRVLSIGSLGKAQEFELSYVIQYSMTYGEKQRISDAIIVKRDMSHNVASALGKSKEEQLIRQELQQQAAASLVRRIQYLQVNAMPDIVPATSAVSSPADESAVSTVPVTQSLPGTSTSSSSPAVDTAEPEGADAQ
ncbi:MAG: LPS assembly lipoprotein LptE [Gammaproteobacteria bacterium]|nr:LPS assembly lipoprotein LptE [Gammaproteobacteria bacterium]MDH5799730.1 LPS assembly lipoprotein LptE [Gammaproteobacteria bacterium]